MTLAAARHIAAEALPELRAVLALACHKAVLAYHAERAWASATFAGVRHTIALEFVGAEAIAYAEAFILHLPDHDFALAGKLCADAAIVHVLRELKPEPRWTVTLELLILENC